MYYENIYDFELLATMAFVYEFFVALESTLIIIAVIPIKFLNI